MADVDAEPAQPPAACSTSAYVGTRYPGDVVAGALSGAAAAALLYLLRPLRRSLESRSRCFGAIWDVMLRRLTQARSAD